MQQAARHLARRIEIRQAIITAFYRPLARFADSGREYFEEGGQFQSDLSDKVADVSPEDLVEPPPSVAVPAMQGLSYSLDEPDLKAMYLNLLATATDGRSAGEAHPAFADVIRQLSPDEAPELQAIVQTDKRHPICELRWITDSRGTLTVMRNVLDFRRGDPPEPAEDRRLAMWVDNWVRLGLVSVSFEGHLARPGAYDWVEARPEYVALQAATPPVDPTDAAIVYRPTFERGYIEATSFGLSFARAVFPS